MLTTHSHNPTCNSYSILHTIQCVLTSQSAPDTLSVHRYHSPTSLKKLMMFTNYLVMLHLPQCSPCSNTSSRYKAYCKRLCCYKPMTVIINSWNTNLPSSIAKEEIKKAGSYLNICKVL